jgi:hypothetical protein
LLLPISAQENQSFSEEKVLFTTKKTENRVKKVPSLKMQGKQEKKLSGKKCQFSNFRAEIKFSSRRKKVKSQVELKILQLKLWLEPAWLKSSLVFTLNLNPKHQFSGPKLSFGVMVSKIK